jgi:hypothetical protein
VTNQKLLERLRRRLRDVDPSAPLYEDEVLWGYVDDALFEFTQRKVAGTTGYTVTDTGFASDAADDVALLCIIGAAYRLLKDLYTDRVQRGELGVSWQSGLEHESTIDQRKAFNDGIRQLGQELEELIIIRASQTSGSRIQ